MHVFNFSRTIHNPGYFRFTCRRYYYLSEPPRYTIHRRFSLSDNATLGRKVANESATRTYQDSHFCSRDVPGASRSELDADCRRFLALYTQHTFAFATRGPSGPGPQVMYPHVIPLCSTMTMTVLPCERPPLPFGTDTLLPLFNFPILTYARTHVRIRASRRTNSPFSTNGSRSLSSSSNACARDA